MVQGESNGALAKVEATYSQRDLQAQELKKEGKKVIGYFCIYPVIEMLTALDLVPYRILGDMKEPITKADACLPTVVCPFVRSALDLGLKGKDDFLDGMVMAHGCEVGEKMAHIWRTYINLPYFHFIDIPHTTHRAAQNQFKEQLLDFKKSLELFTASKLTPEKLKEAIDVHNQQRALVRQLYELRKSTPPLISGVETIKILRIITSIPVQEGNTLLREIIAEVKLRTISSSPKKKRILVWGSIIDDTPLLKTIEDLGADIVIDDTCMGSRAFFPDVEITDDPLDGLTHRYLVDLKCPRTFRDTTPDATNKNHLADLESRFGYLRDYAKEWRIDGVILQSVRFCDIHGYEVPGLGDYLDSLGLPHTYIEHDYSERSLAPIQTRVQAFLEIIS